MYVSVEIHPCISHLSADLRTQASAVELAEYKDGLLRQLFFYAENEKDPINGSTNFASKDFETMMKKHVRTNLQPEDAQLLVLDFEAARVEEVAQVRSQCTGKSRHLEFAKPKTKIRQVSVRLH
jgi:hypothetical protein